MTGPTGRLGRSVVTVVPVTSNLSHVHPFQVALPAEVSGLDRGSKAQAEQARPVAVERIGMRVGTLPPEHFAPLGEALRLPLAL